MGPTMINPFAVMAKPTMWGPNAAVAQPVNDNAWETEPMVAEIHMGKMASETPMQLDETQDSFYLSLIYYIAMSVITLLTTNINDPRDCRQRAALYEQLKQKQADVIFLQEHSDEWVEEACASSHYTYLSSDVSLLFSQSFIPLSYDVEEVFIVSLKVKVF